LAAGKNIRGHFDTGMTLRMAAKRADHAQCGRRMFQMILFVFVLPKKAMNFMYHWKSSLRTSLEIALSVKGFEMGVMPLDRLNTSSTRRRKCESLISALQADSRMKVYSLIH
jgi:hypothetical protein